MVISRTAQSAAASTLLDSDNPKRTLRAGSGRRVTDSGHLHARGGGQALQPMEQQGPRGWWLQVKPV